MRAESVASQSTIGTATADLPCPGCGPGRRAAQNRLRPVLRTWSLPGGRVSFHCVRCGAKGVMGPPTTQTTTQPSRPAGNQTLDRGRVARSLWRKSLPLHDTLAETYLRKARGYGGPLPATLRYLPDTSRHSHAMLAAFGVEPDAAPDELTDLYVPPAVHITRLAPDGCSRLDKRMLGPVLGHPIVLAPLNDGLGLVIAEGIEDALSIHEATGLGAWAAGSASHLARLGDAVPGYVECVTLAEDADDAGRRACAMLAARLIARGIEVRLLSIAAAP